MQRRVEWGWGKQRREWISGFGLRVEGFEFRVSVFEFRALGSSLRVEIPGFGFGREVGTDSPSCSAASRTCIAWFRVWGLELSD